MHITVVGGFGVGKTIQVHRAPEAGETVTGGIYSEGPGGKASNQAVQIARLGKVSALITAVGKDAAASMGYELWEREGVLSEGVVTKDSSTMVGFIIVDDSGENRIALAPGALSEMTIEDLEPLRSLIEGADLVVVSFELNPDVGFAALRMAKSAGVRTMCNPAPAVEIPHEAMEAIDVLVPNYGEACLLAGVPHESAPTPEVLAAKLRSQGAGAVVITLGARGAYVDEETSTRYIDPVPVEKVVDSTGAGDSFVGALAVSLHSGSDLGDAASFAARVSARTVMSPEVIPALPYREELAEASR